MVKALWLNLVSPRGRICFWMESLHPICDEKEKRKKTLLINNFKFNIFLLKKWEIRLSIHLVRPILTLTSVIWKFLLCPLDMVLLDNRYQPFPLLLEKYILTQKHKRKQIKHLFKKAFSHHFLALAKVCSHRIACIVCSLSFVTLFRTPFCLWWIVCVCLCGLIYT